MSRAKKPKLIGRVRFRRNGAGMACYLHAKAPAHGDPSDVVEVRFSVPLNDEEVEDTSFFMNAYDMQNLIFLLSGATTVIYEHHIPLMPEDMMHDLELRMQGRTAH